MRILQLKRRKSLLGGVGLTVAASVAILGWALQWHWGDVPTWVAASATVAALAAAGAGAVGVFRQLDALAEQVDIQAQALDLQGEALRLQAEQAAEDRNDADRRAAQELEVRRVELRRQAEQVEITPREQVHEPPGVNAGMFLILRVENGSGRPIRDVTCKMMLNGGDYTPVEACRFVNPHGTWTAVDRTQNIPLGLLRRRTTIDFVFGLSPDRGRGATYKLRFTDDADLHWELTDDMRLAQIADRAGW